MKDLVTKFHQKRGILVIAVDRQDHVLAGTERVYLQDREDRGHDEYRDEE